MTKYIRVSVLVLVLAASAQAGYMPSGSEEPPPPPAPASAPVVEEPAVESETPEVLAETLTEAALSVLNNVLALL